MKRSATGVALAGVVIFAFMAITSPAEPPPGGAGKARTLSLSSHGVIIKGELGSHCLAVGKRRKVCIDVPFDAIPTRGRLPVQPGGRLAIRTGTAAKLVNVQLIRAEGDPTAPEARYKSRRARRIGTSTQRWVTRLPRDLKGADLVVVFVRYTFGDATFSARLLTDSTCAGRG